MHDENPSRSPSPTSPMTSPAEKERDDLPRKNFVPIQWRVIGGGVLVSTAKKEGDEGETFNPNIDCSLPSKPASTSLPPLKIITRQRSNSIPPTPSITQVNVEHVSMRFAEHKRMYVQYLLSITHSCSLLNLLAFYE